jgi:hypothetical protein
MIDVGSCGRDHHEEVAATYTIPFFLYLYLFMSQHYSSMDDNVQNVLQIPYAYFHQFGLNKSLILWVPLGSTRFDPGNALLHARKLHGF